MNDVNLLRYILNRGVSPLSSDSNGENAIHYAINLERLSLLKLFLEGDLHDNLVEFDKRADSLHDKIESK